MQAFLLGPAAIYLLLADSTRAEFSARLALCLGTLQWLGWTVLARQPARLRFLAVPITWFVGLALTCLWFYLRNAVGWLAPDTYSLVELRLLPGLLWIVHLAAWVVGVRTSAKQAVASRRWVPNGALSRACLYGPLTLTLVLTLWSASREVFVPSQDGWFHAFTARVYLNDGIFHARFNGDRPIVYASGFGAANAVTAAISGLSVVQVSNLQHVLWIVTGLFVVTTTVARVVRRTLPVMHLLPLLLLSSYPLHNLPPDVHWTHGPQQMASALLIVIPLLSLWLPVRSRVSATAGLFAQAALAGLALAMNPACAPFLVFAWIAALSINVVRRRQARGPSALAIGSAQVVCTLAATVPMLAADRYYTVLVRNLTQGTDLNGLHFGAETVARQRELLTLSLGSGVAAVRALDPFSLLGSPDAPELPIDVQLPGAVLALTLACWCWRGRNRCGNAFRRSRMVALIALVGWLGMKYAAVLGSGSITGPSDDALLLKVYLVFLVRRLELWMLLLAALAAGVSLYLQIGIRWAQRRVVLTAVAAVGGVLALLSPVNLAALDRRLNNLVPKNIGMAGRIAPDDIELASWIESHLPAEQGIVGLAALPFRTGQMKLLYPIGASQTLSLYGRSYNFTFQIFDPSRRYGFDDYIERVVSYFDADWCLRENIRFFHVPHGDIYPNHGLARAREIGLLTPVRSVQTSALYAVQPMPWVPERILFSQPPDSSHDIAWHSGMAGTSTGLDPQMVFTLGQRRFVHGIRLHYASANAIGRAASAQLFWKRAGQNFVETERTARLRVEPRAEVEALTILIHDEIDSFRFDPGTGPSTFQIERIELLVRPDSADPSSD